MDSRRRVAAAIVAALCCGAFSAAATAATTLTVATVEAEQMQLPAGASITTDRAASGGEAVQLTTIGSSLTSSLTLSRAVTGIKLVAHGTRCQSGWPAVQVSLDGRSLLRANVSSTSWQGFSAAVSTPAGSHTLAITDTATNACRTLSVDDITFTGPATPAPTISLSATPSSIGSGAASTLQWSTTNATACAASGGWSGSKPVSGSASTGVLLASATFSLTCTGAGGSASRSVTVTVAPSAPRVCQSVVVPAYFYPSAGGMWNSADAATPGVGMMVANANSGPGTALNSDYATAIAQARAAGITVFGYVDTGYGAIATSTVEANINAWKTFYGVTSIFLDDASTSSSELSFYETLTNYVHTQGSSAHTIVNFGTVPAPGEVAAGDILVTFEGDASSYASTRFPSWMAGYAPSRFYNIVYQVPDQLSMLSVLSEAASAGVGDVYATDDTLPNPYDTLPSYLTSEAAQAHSGC